MGRLSPSPRRPALDGERVGERGSNGTELSYDAVKLAELFDANLALVRLAMHYRVSCSARRMTSEPPSRDCFVTTAL